MYRKFSLQQQIILPFLGVFIGLWSLGMLGIGYWLTHYLEREQREKTSEVASLMLREFQKEANVLRSNARLLADSPDLRLAVRRGNKAELLKNLLSIKSTLELDLVQVINKEGETLIDLRRDNLAKAQLTDKKVRRQVLSGVYLSSILSAEEQSQSVLVGAAPFKTREGVVGGIIVGTAVSDDLIQQIKQSGDDRIVAFNKQKIIASTLEDADKTFWKPPSGQNLPKKIEVNGKSYLAKTVELSGLDDALLELVLLEPLSPLNRAKHNLWVSVTGFGVLGGTLASAVGIAIAGSISNRVRKLTKATQQLAIGDFNTRIDLDGNDEISTLAVNFNLMIEQIAQQDQKIRFQLQQLEYTLQKLEMTKNQILEQEKEHSHTLEMKVEQRTQQLVEKNQQLKQTLEQLKTAQKQMIAQEKLASLGSLIAGIAHEIRNPLNFINNFSQLCVDLTEELFVGIDTQKERLDPEVCEYILEILNDLKTNASKIDHHGKRAEKIVSSMLLHSRGGEGNWQVTNFNDLLAESVNLAYHGMRAKDVSFRATFKTDYDYKVGQLKIVPQDINRVFLNIINNACYAISQKKKEVGEGFLPLIKITSKNLGDRVETRIWDNGIGMSKETVKRIFDHFFTTKPTGEGTGLGLSLSHEIIVQQHQGQIDVRSQKGHYTEFIITLPKK
ncbi:MAG: ATP-binding protein [Prochloraceae cyanobacterium]|nr:ATP-binding protein [Prochloraceae cyanobacterium]